MRLLLAVAAFLAFASVAVAQGGRCGDASCRADVSISGHSEPQPIHRGEISTFKFTAKNDGYDGALKIVLSATIPARLKIVSVRHYGGLGCTTKGTYVRCELGDFRREQEAVVRIRVRATKNGTYLSPAKVFASDVTDPNGGNNQVTATLKVVPRG